MMGLVEGSWVEGQGNHWNHGSDDEAMRSSLHMEEKVF